MLRQIGLIVSIIAAIPAFADGDSEKAKAIVVKALKAQKWENDSTTGMITWKEKGKFTAMGMSLDYTSVWTSAGAKFRGDMDMDFGGMKFKFLLTCDGTKAWAASMGQVEELKDEKAEYTINNAYRFYVNSLKPLLSDKQFTLKTTEGIKVVGTDAVGVIVSSKGKTDVSLYFDNKTGYLVKMTTKVKDEFQGWKEVTDESYFMDWKEDGKRMSFTKLKIVRDGKTLIESEESELKFVEKVDDKLFGKPE